MKHVTPSMIVSVVLSLLVVLWVKMTLNGMQLESPAAAKPKSKATKEPSKPPSTEEKSDKEKETDVPASPPPVEVIPQPPPTQLRPTMHWEPHMSAPMTVGRTLIQVEPDPMVEDEGAFEHGE